jgi:hypothetical protein
MCMYCLCIKGYCDHQSLNKLMQKNILSNNMKHIKSKDKQTECEFLFITIGRVVNILKTTIERVLLVH